MSDTTKILVVLFCIEQLSEKFPECENLYTLLVGYSVILIGIHHCFLKHSELYTLIYLFVFVTSGIPCCLLAFNM